MLQMPVLVPCSLNRRSSPAEDYIWTLNGVSSLIDQQQNLLRMFGYQTTKENVDGKISTENPDDDGRVHDDSSRPVNVSLDKYKATSSLEIRDEQLTRSSESSIQTLRRILEIEELKKFSDSLHLRIEARYPEWLVSYDLSCYQCGLSAREPLLLSVISELGSPPTYLITRQSHI